MGKPISRRSFLKKSALALGILASTDILAVDQASIDMVYKLPEAELHDLKERIESRKGLRQLSYMKEMQMGNDQYELITI